MDIVSRPSTGRRQDVFVIGVDKALWHTWDDGAAWHEWQSLGGTLTSAPAAVWTDTRLDVYARGTDNAMWHIYWDDVKGAWSEWELMGGELISGPVVAAKPIPGPQGPQGLAGPQGPAGTPADASAVNSLRDSLQKLKDGLKTAALSE